MQKLVFAILAFSFANFASADPIKPAVDEADYTVDADGFINLNQKAFKPGEKLVYRLSYGVWDAGEATLSVLNTKKTVKGRELWRVRGDW